MCSRNSRLSGWGIVLLLALLPLTAGATAAQGPLPFTPTPAAPSPSLTPTPAGETTPVPPPGIPLPERIEKPRQPFLQEREEVPATHALGLQEAQPYDGVAVAPDGTVYVADTYYHRIQAFGTAYPTTWRGEYFGHRWLAERPLVIRNESAIAFEWADGSPDPAIPADFFSCRWQRYVHFEQSGFYRFTIFIDDGGRLWVDDRLLIDEWQHKQRQEYSASIYLDAGYHRVRLEHYEYDGQAAAYLEWEKLSQVYLPLVLRDYVVYFEGPWEMEPNNSYLQANGPLRSGRDYYGYPNDKKDYFSIYLRTGGTITIDLSNHTGSGVQLQLFYQNVGNRVAGDLDPPYRITYNNGSAGWYYVYIYTAGNYNSTTPYTLWATHP